MDKEQFIEDLKRKFFENKGKIIGGLIGFFFGVLLLVIGFFKTLLILICTLAGYYLGSRKDLNGSFKKLLDKILPPQIR